MTQVVLLPGGVLPAELAYPALLEALGPGVETAVKDLELYAGDEPPADYGLDTEVRGIERTAAEAGFERFHLVGYSAGGASVLAFASAHPNRVLSLALLEPAWAGSEMTPEERATHDRFERIMQLPPEQMMKEFVTAELAPGVEPPASPEGPPPPWMAKRPPGLRAVVQAFARYELDLGAIRDIPTYYALGGLSHPDYYARQAERLRGVFSDFTLEVFEERHHFDPPHRIEPKRLAASLRRHWERNPQPPS